MVFFKSALVAWAVAGVMAAPHTQPSSLDIDNTDFIKPTPGSLAPEAVTHFNDNVSSDSKVIDDLVSDGNDKFQFFDQILGDLKTGGKDKSQVLEQIIGSLTTGGNDKSQGLEEMLRGLLSGTNNKPQSLEQRLKPDAAVKGNDPDLVLSTVNGWLAALQAEGKLQGEMEIEDDVKTDDWEDEHRSGSVEAEIRIPGLEQLTGGMDRAELTIEWDEDDDKRVRSDRTDTMTIKLHADAGLNGLAGSGGAVLVPRPEEPRQPGGAKNPEKTKQPDQSGSSAVVSNWTVLALVFGSQVFWGMS